ncbi:5-(carboxyamino)imidazole ribonucleotide synthase [Glycomyces algeriensis]|uniref:N5-carboxyaminoimidazole ribonucleotide synthase n=1 Tax=Glycomyces algeriensis TaxID=256037 RepID=A0A9W6G3V0_9ACTN|nr:5-(carboxyamino)imidazole ribonucleotide synthase [Glycomyces algeriensis]MDA1368906.1 5-(carboxyamino)imidazole ribonucleotide synthase [Glycomyces algeriensis]MDR7352820.1 5-(carboxyamino)imidazole ribonucleotide synthase [Glycomyces algeriensis]GLI40505.1 N5-carboxyaminoimidazole ribonucleotide synthase [Glycomyces algeriensis]
MDAATQLPTVGMIGAGQLARMTHQAAIALGQSLRVLAGDPAESAAVVTPATVFGDYRNVDDLRAFAKGCTVVTFDHEHVPQDALRALAAEGVEVQPRPEALLYAQDKQAMRTRLAGLGLPQPRWAPVDSISDVEAFGLPCVLKAATGGYDGKGVWMIDTPGDAQAVLASGIRLIAEERMALQRELAVQIARSPRGETAVYPVVETVQTGGICTEVIAPAPHLSDETAAEARRIAETIAKDLDVCGMLAVELFQTSKGLFVNELAMRAHNSGHWTIEGARTSQFEQHLRAVLDYPLGSTETAAPYTVMANVLGGAPGGPRIDERLQHLLAEDPGAHVHLYGKAVRPGRKIGHVTVCGDDPDVLRHRALRAAKWLQEGE